MIEILERSRRKLLDIGIMLIEKISTIFKSLFHTSFIFTPFIL